MKASNKNFRLKKKINVAWICYFKNPHIFRKIPLSKKIPLIESAPWIFNTLKQFYGDPEVKLYIISPREGLKRLIYSFHDKNITYIFYKCDIPLIHKKLWKIPLYLNRFLIPKYYYILDNFIINCLIHKISPDIIHLQGAENAKYSSSIFQFKDKYPVFVTIQGFVSKTQAKISKYIKYRIDVEKRILKEFSHFGIRTKSMGEDIKKINPKAVLHWHGYGMNKLNPIDVKKEYDLVFFARICKDKGIEDLLKAVAIIKKTKPEVSLIVIGPGSSNYVSFLKNKAKDLGLEKNIHWAGFQPTEKDVHILASKAKISVLPTYHDIISGTIIESMKLGIPVVAYKTGSIPEVNEGEKRIEIVERFNVEKLANRIIMLLDNEEYRNELSEKAMIYANDRFSNKNVKQEILNAYKSIINAFNEGN